MLPGICKYVSVLMLLRLDIVYCCTALIGPMRIVVPAVEDLMNRPLICSAADRVQIPVLNPDDNQVRPISRSNS